MAEDISYWICSCGKSNLKITKKCGACQKRRPRSWVLYSCLAIISLVVFGIISKIPPQLNTVKKELPVEQRDFLFLISSARDAAGASHNSLAFNEVLKLRDSQLAKFLSVERWTGTIVGIQKIQEKGAISIDIGGTTVLAGVHLSYGLDTLIHPTKNTIYDGLLSLKRGDRVQFSGRFLIYNGSLVEMSYTRSSSILTPEFLFEFSAVKHAP